MLFFYRQACLRHPGLSFYNVEAVMKNFPFLTTVPTMLIPCLVIPSIGCGPSKPTIAEIDKDNPAGPVVVKSKDGTYPLDRSSDIIIGTTDGSFFRLSVWWIAEEVE